MSFSGKFTMYRSMVYFLGSLLGATILASIIGILSYNAFDIFLQTVLFIIVCLGVNFALAKVFKVSTNTESSIITALILASIVGPLSLPGQWLPLVLISLAAIASKYLIAFNKSHVFNPAAFGVVASAIIIGFPASWWIGGSITMPIILLGGLLMAVKIRRVHLVTSFFAAYGGLLAIGALSGGADIIIVKNTLLSASFLFFVFVMLIEPLTSPQTRKNRIYFGAFTGVLLFLLQTFAPQLPYSLGLSLLAGNVFTRVISPAFQQIFVLKKKEELSPSVVGFWLEPARNFSFKAGQFLEYTLAHKHPDSRGFRRFFTIASAPSEKNILLVSKFSEDGSSFKRALRKMNPGDEITASRVGGEFVLPGDKNQKLVFIAGGVGITPFRSMIKHLADLGEKRDIIMLYSARKKSEFVFRELLDEAAEKIGIKNIYILSDNKESVGDWDGRTGPIDARLIKEEVADPKERKFFISGPEVMVRNVEKIIIDAGVPKKNIKRDYFPGY